MSSADPEAAWPADISRRNFLAGSLLGLSAALVGCPRKSEPPLPPGRLIDPGLPAGHRLREPWVPLSTSAKVERRQVPVLIVGSGIGGLSAARRLQRSGFEDYLLLESQATLGGNSQSSANDISAYPLGAHYLPLPGPEAVHVRELLAELGVLHGPTTAETPSYDERYLVHAPQERLYRDGYWQEGLAPHWRTSRQEREEMARFFAQLDDIQHARDATGRRAFAIPSLLSSHHPRWRTLDQRSFTDWLDEHQFRSPALRWYLDYACRDDYGTRSSECSAWAGLHYFASRNGRAANASSEAVLTAPGGNGWIVQRLAQMMPSPHQRVLLNTTVQRVEESPRGVRVMAWIEANYQHGSQAPGHWLSIEAEALIWAAPIFVWGKVSAAPTPVLQKVLSSATWAPWLVANLSLRAPPDPGAGAPLSWDNVPYGSAGLGYVLATHQQIRVHHGPTVLTWYEALAHMPPAEARQHLFAASHEQLAHRVLRELARMHHRLHEQVTQIDIVRHGHAMIRPTPGLISTLATARTKLAGSSVQFAHADLSGLSLFEEAQYHGETAARAVLERSGGKPRATA